MYVRFAFFEGSVAPDDQERFDHFMQAEIAPIVRSFPGIRDFRIYKGEWFEEGLTPYYQVFQLTFDSKADMERALASSERARNVEKLREILPLFKGRVLHMNTTTDAT